MGPVFELFATLGLDKSGFEEGLKDGETESKGFLSKIGGGLKTVGKAAAAGVAVAATAVAGLTKQSVAGYAEYEQLVGGVETLFKDSAGIVQGYAQNAYKTAGLSANQYMETVTSFSASLLQSLDGDTQAAANYADKAITDMSDNANKMGSSMESIQTAYQGFAKQNYTMLDNLKLGYGGTKTEMERLILDAEKLDSSFKATRDENGNLAMSYADIVDAIHIVQTDMGITGTTAKEASTTISGSIASMKSAWDNLLVGLADDNANIEDLVNNLVTSIIGEDGEGGVLNNILPAVEKAMNGIVTLVTTAAPKIIPIIVDIITKNLPQLINAGIQVLVALIVGITKAIPELIKAIPQIINAIKDGLVAAWPDIKAAGADLLTQLIDGITEWIANLADIGSQIVGQIANGISSAWDGLTRWFNGLWSGLFGGRNVDVNVNGRSNYDGSHAGGLDYVPWNGYIAQLHQGEAVLTAREAAQWRGGNTAQKTDDRPIIITVNSILDGKKIGESVSKYNRDTARAYG